MNRHETALHFVRMGWPVFPCNVKEKTPATRFGFKDASSGENQINEWWSRKDYNLGLPTGKNLVVLDADCEEALASVRALGTKDPPTVRTGRGWQWYFEVPEFEVRNSAGKISTGIDVRGVGGYVVAPPSIHPNGKSYEWDVFPFRLLPFPDWLRVFTRPKTFTRDQEKKVTTFGEATAYGRKALQKQCSRVFCSPSGTRNSTLAAAAFGIGQLVASGNLSQVVSEEELIAAAMGAGLDRKSSMDTVKRCLAAGMKNPFFPARR